MAWFTTFTDRILVVMAWFTTFTDCVLVVMAWFTTFTDRILVVMTWFTTFTDRILVVMAWFTTFTDCVLVVMTWFTTITDSPLLCLCFSCFGMVYYADIAEGSHADKMIVHQTMLHAMGVPSLSPISDSDFKQASALQNYFVPCHLSSWQPLAPSLPYNKTK